LLRPWTSTPPTVIRCAEYTFRARVVDRWRTERTFLLGDAAHLIPPFIGQGLGAGLRDAHNLAWKLAAVLAGRANEELLGSYPRERDPHVRATIRTALLVGRAMTGGGGPAALVRRPLAAALLRLPGAEERALAAVATRFPPGPAVERRGRHDLAGTLCPQPRLAESVLLDEAVGPGWGLLHAGPVDARTAAAARATGARTIDVSSTPLHSWLQSGRTTAALLRPDRVVARTAPLLPTEHVLMLLRTPSVGAAIRARTDSDRAVRCSSDQPTGARSPVPLVRECRPFPASTRASERPRDPWPQQRRP